MYYYENSNSELFEKLIWDSNFFKLNVYKIKNTNNVDELIEVLLILKKIGANLIYYSSTSPLIEFNDISKIYDVNFVDRKMTYSKKIDEKSFYNPFITGYKKDYPEKDLLNLAVQSGVYSRFNLDKRIGITNYENLYKEWIINSVNKKFAKEVLVYYDEDIIAGFATLGEKNSIADIGIIAVNSNYRGKGIGKSLIHSSENWFLNKDYKNIQVVTQGDNIPACKLYESCGYKVSRLEYFYHFWEKN